MGNSQLYSTEMDVFIYLSQAHKEQANKIIVSSFLKENDMTEIANNIDRTYFNFITPQNDILYALFHTHYKDGMVEDILIPKDFCVREYFSHNAFKDLNGE